MKPAGLLLFLLGCSVVGRAEVELPPGRGALLPLQDRVGEPGLAEISESVLARELGARAALVDPRSVRTVLRELRIRDAADEPPDRLTILADRLGAEWFFLATLHEARQGREARRDDGGPGTGPLINGSPETPQVAISARVIHKGSTELWWSGFTAGSGRDREAALGLGTVDDLEELLQEMVATLVAEAAAPRAAGGRARLRHRNSGYLRAENPPAPPSRVAVVPLDSVAKLTPGLSAEVATAALFATLDRRGFRALLPGLVRTIRQENGQPQPGAASRSEWQALAREAGADWVATGTVETYRGGQGRTPDPWVAFSIRFVDTADGSIGWLDGLERTGNQTASVFDRGRIYAAGDLTYAMMQTLFDRIRPSAGAARIKTGGAN